MRSPRVVELERPCPSTCRGARRIRPKLICWCNFRPRPASGKNIRVPSSPSHRAIGRKKDITAWPSPLLLSAFRHHTHSIIVSRCRCQFDTRPATGSVLVDIFAVTDCRHRRQERALSVCCAVKAQPEVSLLTLPSQFAHVSATTKRAEASYWPEALSSLAFPRISDPPHLQYRLQRGLQLSGNNTNSISSSFAFTFASTDSCQRYDTSRPWVLEKSSQATYSPTAIATPLGVY